MTAHKRTALGKQSSSPRRRRRSSISIRYIWNNTCARLRNLGKKIQPRGHIFHLLCGVHTNCQYVRNLAGTVKGHYNPSLLKCYWTHKGAHSNHTWRPVNNGIKTQLLFEIYNNRKMPEEVMRLATSIYHSYHCCYLNVPLPNDSMNAEEKIIAMTAVAFSDRSDAYYEELRRLQRKLNRGRPLFKRKEDTKDDADSKSGLPASQYSSGIIYKSEEEGLEPFPDFYYQNGQLYSVPHHDGVLAIYSCDAHLKCQVIHEHDGMIEKHIDVSDTGVRFFEITRRFHNPNITLTPAEHVAEFTGTKRLFESFEAQQDRYLKNCKGKQVLYYHAQHSSDLTSSTISIANLESAAASPDSAIASPSAAADPNSTTNSDSAALVEGIDRHTTTLSTINNNAKIEHHPSPNRALGIEVDKEYDDCDVAVVDKSTTLAQTIEDRKRFESEASRRPDETFVAYERRLRSLAIDARARLRAAHEMACDSSIIKTKGTDNHGGDGIDNFIDTTKNESTGGGDSLDDFVIV